ncbi:C40 family peptidase [Emticicia sp. BO119]|uniref:C40 family peptidase n=1 Tax=Emticicia sp. BO119 TaxID=2757768 RepID=UPI0015F0C059|nr:C40 family peptidase [Emticicia sp. BO119]MBA4852279.1 C40 family peptidase [Emticicia sp. BO119]
MYYPLNTRTKLYVLFVLIGLSNTLFAQINQIPATHPTVQAIIEQVKKKYAPDKRTTVFQIALDSNLLVGKTNLPLAKKELLNRLHTSGYAIPEEIRVLPDEEELEGKIFALVNVSVANIRSMPRESAELATQALLGTSLKVLEKDRNWYLVQTPDHYIGWVDGSTIKRKLKAEIDTYQSQMKLMFARPFGFAYTSADENTQTVSDLTWGDLFVVKDTLTDFYEVAYPDARKGFIPKREAISYQDWKQMTTPSPEALTKTAFRMIGLPYLWGGTSWKGVDCSGYMRMVYQTNGILLPRDASQQAFVGEDVAFENLKVGDLLFFGEKATPEKPERVVHVGMWLGNNEFIHSSGMVRVSSFDATSANYDAGNANRYLRAKHILGLGVEKGVVSLKN